MDDADFPNPPLLADQAFADAMVLLRIAADPKGCQARLDAFIAASTKIKGERADADRVHKERTAALDAREAELAQLKKDYEALFAEAENRKEEADQRYAAFEPYKERVQSQARGVHSRMAALAGISWNPELQAGPSQGELDRAVFSRGLDDPQFGEIAADPNRRDILGRPIEEISNPITGAIVRPGSSELTNKRPEPRARPSRADG